MAVNAPVDIDSLKVEDVVIKSTPQQRELPKEPEKKEPPAKEPEKKEPEKKEPEAKKEPEKKEPEKKQPDAKKDEIPAPGSEKKEPPAKEPEKKEPEKEEETEFNWEAFSEEVGVDVASDEEVIESLKQLAGYKSLSPALQAAIEIEQKGGDVAGYFRAVSNDPKALSERDALWEQYMTENPKRVAANPKFARLDFDRKLDKEYSLLTEYEKLPAEEKEEFLTEHKAEIDYLKEKRTFEAEAARASLQETRDKAKFLPPKAQADESKIKQIMANHEINYKKAWADFDVVSLNMGKDFEFNVGVNEGNKKKAMEWMKNPEAFLKELGFRGMENPSDPIDYDVLTGWVALIADIKYGNFGERLREALVDNKNIDTLEKTLDAPGVGKDGGAKPELKGDEWDQVGEAFEKKRLESQKKK